MFAHDVLGAHHLVSKPHTAHPAFVYPDRQLIPSSSHPRCSLCARRGLGLLLLIPSTECTACACLVMMQRSRPSQRSSPLRLQAPRLSSCTGVELDRVRNVSGGEDTTFIAAMSILVIHTRASDRALSLDSSIHQKIHDQYPPSTELQELSRFASILNASQI